MSGTTANELLMAEFSFRRRIQWSRLFARAFGICWFILLVVFLFPSAMKSGVEWIIYTPEERAELRAVDAMFSHIQMVHVACAPGSNQSEWMTYAATKGWPVYAPAGPGCFSPNRKIDRSDLVNFMVACPATPFNAADQQRWVAYASARSWAPYPQAGATCVDP